MKRNQWRILTGIAVLLTLVGIGLKTFERSQEINLDNGMMREVHQAFGLRYYLSPGKETPLTRVLGLQSQPTRWLTLAKEGFSYPRARISFCYPYMLSKFNAVDRIYNNHKLSTFTAKMTLEELEKTKDACLVRKHLEKFLEVLEADYDDLWNTSTLETEIPRIWDKTRAAD